MWSVLFIALVVIVAAVAANPFCSCSDNNHMPVCGKDGMTYNNPCEMRCRNVGMAYEGECNYKRSFDDNCMMCRHDYRYTPVCGQDGNTYNNECFLNCRGVEKDYDGECSYKRSFYDSCKCPSYEYRPMCGIDGTTYRNECFLRCRGVGLAYYGPCQGIGRLVEMIKSLPESADKKDSARK